MGVPPIIDPTEFKSVQRLLKSRRRLRREASAAPRSLPASAVRRLGWSNDAVHRQERPLPPLHLPHQSRSKADPTSPMEKLDNLADEHIERRFCSPSVLSNVCRRSSIVAASALSVESRSLANYASKQPKRRPNSSGCTAPSNAPDVKRSYATASIVSADRIVFNIKRDDYRLVMTVDFEKSIVWIKWVGTHRDYDKTDVKEVRHGG